MRYCPKCGINNIDNAALCKNCGTRVEEYTNTFEKPAIEPYYVSAPINTKPIKRGKKALIIASAVIVASILIIAGFLVVFINSNEKEPTELDILISNIGDKIDGTPTPCIQALASGNLPSIPDEKCLAKYYLYTDGEKIGELIEGNVGPESYNGINCYKILGRSNVETEFSGIAVAFQMEYTYYVEKSTNFPVYMSIVYDYSQPSQLKGIDITVSVTWDQSSGEITTKSNAMGHTSTATSIFPTEYWGLVSSVDDLYVGYNEEIEYTISSSDFDEDVEMNMQISVTGKEDITVPSGTFENCYILEVEQTQSDYSVYGSFEATTKIWITEDGEFPQSEISMSTSGIPIDITSKLEGYYSTI